MVPMLSFGPTATGANICAPYATSLFAYT